MNQINLENYFDKGFDLFKLPDNIIKKLWLILQDTKWIRDPDNTYKSIPIWYNSEGVIYQSQDSGGDRDVVERIYGKSLLEKCPKNIIEIAYNIINLNFFDPLRFFKKQTELKYIHLWNGAEEIPWHMDTVDGSDTLLLIYLTEQTDWDNNWGGCVGLRKELSNEIKHEILIQPLSGNTIVINNANPLVKHRVYKLKNTNINRYTLSLCFNWST